MAEATVATSGAAAAGSLVGLAGKYLSFRIGEEEYGLPILKVQEIIGMMQVTRVPRVPPFIRGVINLRGKVIPVLDVRKKFGLEEKADTERTCIIVVRIDHGGERMTMGMLVDEVSEVLNIAGDQIEAAPSFGAGIHTDFILGLGKVATKVVMLLDIDSVLESGEFARLASPAAPAGITEANEAQ